MKNYFALKQNVVHVNLSRVNNATISQRAVSVTEVVVVRKRDDLGYGTIFQTEIVALENNNVIHSHFSIRL
jgi:hypothetical protein